ncbi:MAG: class I SAM-dependent methyltransferase [Eubacterium sp.]|jgi:23S rRNA (cytosine1962-C5)-methyltransferase|nr:class I SAM-dependent methyltransferase [Eubacterium sp.]
MRVATEWKDYELIDCAAGEKLERWGSKILIRPDPQVIWKTYKAHRLWAQPAAKYFRSKTGGGQWKVFTRLPGSWQIRYRDLTFNIKTMGFKHTGIFPEQAVNWDLTRDLIRSRNPEDVKVLNLFAYTGAATVACLKEGASVVHVDASKGMTNWAKENAKASGVEEGNVRWIVDDCIKFVQREIKRENRYDIVILDPPSYGRGPRGEVWHIEDAIFDFVALVEQVLSDNPIAVIINSYTTGLSPSVMKYILDETITKRRGGYSVADEIGLPVTQTGGVLPCGATAVWFNE